ncbi:BREX-3 system P-loop-containing protein BrxF [Legionella pneumophila]|uniref:BREX-3 system P-loop-containing protein BrxF n=1 Tax=Legionella pneumophila TaxID=446 RepID=UPI00077794D3|nr:BREX-3 system P-loop-containing protein BrxF [Legionella pneumophila]HAT8643598.1 BREX-3 system P-loop-containing protein BrxF [Legionella pneumophila]
MSELIHNNIIQCIQSTKDLYHRLVILVGRAGSGKTSILRDIANDYGTTIINVNLEVSNELLELTEKQRSLYLPQIFSQITDKAKSSVVILDNLEIIFDRNLNQDPLRLLQSLSRNCTIVASWNGVVTAGKLSYAELGHPEYRNYDLIDTLIVNIDEIVTADLSKNINEAK